MKTIFSAILLVWASTMLSSAQTQPASGGSANEQVFSHEAWIGVGYTNISNGAIGTDQVTGGSANDLHLNGGTLVVVRFDFNQGEHLGHEFEFQDSRAQIQYNYEANAKQGAALNRGGYNLLGYLNRKQSKVRVFGTVGAGWTYFVRPSDSEIGCEGANCTEAGQPPTTAGNNKIDFSYGGGVKFLLSRRFALRFDVRQYINTKPFNLPYASGLLYQTEVSGAFGIRF
jgi:hypothetical protein